MSLINIDLRHVRTGVRLTHAEIAEAAYLALCIRTANRQRAAKEALNRRGITPRTPIGTGYVPPAVARVFTHSNVRGLA
ncbi:hypothetical protein [Paraburkholderia caballeronis]|uniref:Uncharacterized protein n=1 Tax=Paraburkholderia caballeronis TaxID=416943 RepID=A0A1H7TZS5_9BURK|nr:hypothetical protein [Paraburkholderia caballeronis]PXW23380.1 hypothetical protein C7403_110118 [Paraburkholderia caballeronis]PXW98373.1 hypothetical protein C7407_110118 [Paraburkholderia caballeronis]RAJ95104.1 hypothetical protein C7409_110119 [Paraburkholderia caballeronis]SEC56996.1 hypothetical protein SAMN05445871_2442 [Paraburkholderia caballeronis]SEL89477.1 hypothetical protein SAMN05192542_1178 [Paraburkholderia caballeronis]